MADLSDVSNALVTLITGVVYPNGTSQPSITGNPVVVYSGWPNMTQLKTDLQANKAHVSIFPTTSHQRHANTAFSDWTVATPPANTLALSVTAQTVMVNGTVSTPQNVVLLVDGRAYAYAVQASDTPASIATALATLVAVDRPATAADSSITIPNATYISARVGGIGTVQRETRRQERTFLISAWANGAAPRDLIAGKVDAVLSSIVRLTLPDQGAALRYKRGHQYDDLTNGIYRRELRYAVEYATIVTDTAYQIATGVENVTAGAAMDGQFPVRTLVQ